MSPRAVAAAVIATLVALSGCGSGNSADPDKNETNPDDTNSTTSTTRADPTEPDSAEATTIEWEIVEPGGDCMCADGSDYSFAVREADPTELVVFFDGGGACFDAESCDFVDGSYDVTAKPPTDDEGIFDVANPDNPFADHSMVRVSYCTGDIHVGNKVTTYADGLTVHHVGWVNAMAAIDETVRRFPEAERIVVTGVSAGSAPAPLYGGVLADRYPNAQIAVLADGSGAYPNVPALNGAIGGLWGHLASVPDWESTKGVTAETWSLPGLYTYAQREHPDIVFARHDYAYDDTQVFYAQLAGIDGAAKLLDHIDAVETEIEASGVDLSTFLAPDAEHTILASDRLYDESVDGTALLDWVERLARFETPGDVHCTDCGSPAR